MKKTRGGGKRRGQSAALDAEPPPGPLGDVKVYDVPPDDFDPLSAERDALLRFGLPLRPDPVAEPALHAFWSMLFTPPVKFALATFTPLQQPFGLGHLPTPRVGGNRERSLNWSGAYVTPSVGRMFTELYGAWQVPMPAPPAAAAPTGEWRSSTWIGLDGQRRYLNSSLPQIGTSQFVTRRAGQPAQVALGTWWQWWVRGVPNQQPTPLNLTVNVDDLVMAVLTVIDPTHVRFFMRNVTTGVALTPFDASPAVAGIQVSGATAEWIVERPTQPNSSVLFDLADYGTVAFGGCLAVSAPTPGNQPRTTHMLSGARLIDMYEVLRSPSRTQVISQAQLQSAQQLATAYR